MASREDIMASDIATRSTKFLRPDHADFDIVGKPALVLLHMQRGLAGEGLFIPNWGPKVRGDIDDSLMIRNCDALAKAFRAKGLPVVFVNAIPNPTGRVPAYGDLFREIEAGRTDRHWFTDERQRAGLEVQVDLEYDAEKDDVLFNWLIGAFTNSGLDVVLRDQGVETIVWGGFAQQSACFNSSIVAGDLWFNSIIPVDASVVVVPPTTPGYYPGLEDVVAEAVVRVLIPAISQATDTSTVLAKVSEL